MPRVAAPQVIVGRQNAPVRIIKLPRPNGNVNQSLNNNPQTKILKIVKSGVPAAQAGSVGTRIVVQAPAQVANRNVAPVQNPIVRHGQASLQPQSTGVISAPSASVRIGQVGVRPRVSGVRVSRAGAPAQTVGVLAATNAGARVGQVGVRPQAAGVRIGQIGLRQQAVSVVTTPNAAVRLSQAGVHSNGAGVRILQTAMRPQATSASIGQAGVRPAGVVAVPHSAGRSDQSSVRPPHAGPYDARSTPVGISSHVAAASSHLMVRPRYQNAATVNALANSTSVVRQSNMVPVYRNALAKGNNQLTKTESVPSRLKASVKTYSKVSPLRTTASTTLPTAAPVINSSGAHVSATTGSVAASDSSSLLLASAVASSSVSAPPTVVSSGHVSAQSYSTQLNDSWSSIVGSCRDVSKSVPSAVSQQQPNMRVAINSDINSQQNVVKTDAASVKTEPPDPACASSIAVTSASQPKNQSTSATDFQADKSDIKPKIENIKEEKLDPDKPLGQQSVHADQKVIGGAASAKAEIKSEQASLESVKSEEAASVSSASAKDTAGHLIDEEEDSNDGVSLMCNTCMH